MRADAFDETVLEKLIDDEAMGVLTLLFKTSEVSTTTPAPNGWALDWDVATIIEALEECYPLLPEQKYLDRGSKWSAAVKSPDHTYESPDQGSSLYLCILQSI